MDVKPTNGLKVRVGATREAIFGEDGVEVKQINQHPGHSTTGTMTGRTLVGFAEVEIAGGDGKKHWYPVEQLTTENGERVVEEELAIEMPDDDSEGDDSDEE